MKLIPLNDKIVVRRAEADSATKSGILLPDSAKEKPVRGEVLAAGPGKLKEDGTRQAMDVRIGDVVLFERYSGSEVEIDGEKYILMSAECVLGLLS